MNKTGLILINGRHEKLAYGTSVRRKRTSISIHPLQIFFITMVTFYGHKKIVNLYEITTVFKLDFFLQTTVLLN